MRVSQTGFGAVELMIALGLAGAFLAVSVPMFLRSVHDAQTADAQLELDRIGHAARRHFEDTGSYVVGTARELPVQPGGSCCHGVDERCAADPATFAADPVWRALDFDVYEPSTFYYDYTGSATAFVATAAGDLDCDGATTVLTLNGVSMATAHGRAPVITPGPAWLEPTP